MCGVNTPATWRMFTEITEPFVIMSVSYNAHHYNYGQFVPGSSPFYRHYYVADLGRRHLNDASPDGNVPKNPPWSNFGRERLTHPWETTGMGGCVASNSLLNH